MPVKPETLLGAPVQGGGRCPICGGSSHHRFLGHRQGQRGQDHWVRGFCTIGVAWWFSAYQIDVSRLTGPPGWPVLRPLDWWRSVSGVSHHIRPNATERIGTPLARRGEETRPAIVIEVDPDYDPSIF